MVTATTALDGWPVELCDTAGLRASREAIEIEGVRLARQAATAADALVLVFMPRSRGKPTGRNCSTSGPRNHGLQQVRPWTAARATAGRRGSPPALSPEPAWMNWNASSRGG